MPLGLHVPAKPQHAYNGFCALAASMSEMAPVMLQGASEARKFTQSLVRGPREYLVAVRGEGQFVGEMASFATAALRCASVRARGLVRAKLIPGELLADCVQRIPEVSCKDTLLSLQGQLQIMIGFLCIQCHRQLRF